jgi:hypothetical protein
MDGYVTPSSQATIASDLFCSPMRSLRLCIALVCVVTLTPTSPTVDFSYDFQDLLLKPKKTP